MRWEAIRAFRLAPGAAACRTVTWRRGRREGAVPCVLLSRHYCSPRSGAPLSLTRALLSPTLVLHSQASLALSNEDALLRSLVQDALDPSTRLPSAEGETSVGPISSAVDGDAGLQEGGDPGAAFEQCGTASATEGGVSKPRPGLVGSAVKHMRASNAAIEPFCRVRRQIHAQATQDETQSALTEDSVEWMCMMCHTFNFLHRSTCRHCGSSATDSHRSKYPPARQVVLFPATWVCGHCGCSSSPSAPVSATPSSQLFAKAAEPTAAAAATAAREKFFCTQCHAPFGGAEDWRCPSCHCMNSRAAGQCATCFQDRPPRWSCLACGEKDNSIFLRQCRGCGQPPSPVFESDCVVRCTSCQARNDVRWELCEGCLAPMPALHSSRGRRSRDSRAAALTRSTPPAVRHVSATTAPKPPLPLTDATAVGESSPVAAVPLSSSTANLGLSSPPTPVSSEPDTQKGAWWCVHCNVVQRRNAPFCDICLRPKYLAEQRETRHDQQTSVSSNAGGAGDPQPGGNSPESAVVPSPMTGVPSGAWQCPYCRAYHPATTMRCCEKDREVAQGYWLCKHCGSTNRSDRPRCLGCGAAPSRGPWVCSVCAAENGADDFHCITCTAPHPSFWQCATCHTVVEAGAALCPHCGSVPPPSPASVACPVCRAPNAATRKACFRCRGRLQAEGWKCRQCETFVVDRLLTRCPHCRCPRDFNTAEECWVCSVCETCVASGGDLPVRSQCPRCGSQRDPARDMSFPSRWRCRRCHVFNNASRAACEECEEPRYLAELHTMVYCPHCFHRTLMDASEACKLCSGSLSTLLDNAGAQVSLTGRGMFAGLDESEGRVTEHGEWSPDAATAEGTALPDNAEVEQEDHGREVEQVDQDEV